MGCVFVRPGQGGWGVGLVICPSGKKNKVASVTSGGIHPVAQRIGTLLHCEVIDSFTESVPEDEILCAVVDCGGTARIGVYPRKGILTIDVNPISPSGPLVRYITDELFVSGVSVEEVSFMENESLNLGSAPNTRASHDQNETEPPILNTSDAANQSINIITKLNINGSSYILRFINRALYVLGVIRESAKDTIHIVLFSVLPLMLVASLFITLVKVLDLVGAFTSVFKASLGSWPGLIAVALILTLPKFASSFSAAGIVGQYLIIMLAFAIGARTIGYVWLLPALIAVNGQVGSDFLPTALGMSNTTKSVFANAIKIFPRSREITTIVMLLMALMVSLLIFGK